MLQGERSLHAAELQAVGVSLMTSHQVVVVENPYPEHCGVDTDAKEENAAEAHHLVERVDGADKRAKAPHFNSYANSLCTSYHLARSCSCVFQFAYLNTNVVLFFFSHLNKYSEERENWVQAEESAL